MFNGLTQVFDLNMSRFSSLKFNVYFVISFKTGRMFYQGMENKDGKQWCGYKIANQYYVPNLLESCAKESMYNFYINNFFPSRGQPVHPWPCEKYILQRPSLKRPERKTCLWPFLNKGLAVKMYLTIKRAPLYNDQCGQIGRFFKVLGIKFSYKSILKFPNVA